MCAYVVTQSPMEELNPVSDTHALLESMLQKLRLNTQTNTSSLADMQTCGPTGECNAEPVGDSSKAAVYQFGSSSYSNQQDSHETVWNKWENPWSQQPSHLTPVGKQPFRRISKNSRFSKPKRPPLIWGENKHSTSEWTNDVTSWDQMSSPKQSDDQMPSSLNVSPLNKTESFRNPPDLLALTSSAVSEAEVKGQSDRLGWAVGNEKHEGTTFHQNQPGGSTKTRKWGEAKRWAQNVKEKWRERHRSTPNKQRGDGERRAQNEMQSNHCLLSGPVNVNNTPMALAETPEIHHEPISTAPDEDGPGSLDYMSDSLFSFDTNNLMEEIFSGTQWAQFLSGNCTMLDQSNKPPICINQSREEELNSKWTHEHSTDSHVEMTQPSLLENLAEDMISDKPVYNQPGTSSVPSQVTDLTMNSLNIYNPYTVQSQNLEQPYNSEQSIEQSKPDPNESKVTEESMSCQESKQESKPEATEDFIPLLDLSYIKPNNRSSITSFGSLSRKREHWTKRSDPFEQDMEDEDNSIPIRAKRSNSVHNVSPTSSLDSLPDSITEDPVSSGSVVKKRRMTDTRRVRFAEEVIIFPTNYLAEFNEEDDDDDEDDDDEDNANDNDKDKYKEDASNNYPEVTSPRPSFPKWIVSLKGRSAKYKF